MRFKHIKRAYAVYKATKYAETLMFSERQWFFAALRHPFGDGTVCAYPDAFTQIDMSDYKRAVSAVNDKREIIRRRWDNLQNEKIIPIIGENK